MEDKELFARYKKLYSALITDSFDKLVKLGDKTPNYCLDYNIRPLKEDFTIIGRALPMKARETGIMKDNPFDKLLLAIEDLKKGEVIVETMVDGETLYGGWGELVSTAAMVRGSNGAIINGLTRDAKGIKKCGFPVFAKGFTPNDSNGRNEIIDIRCDIVINGVKISNGDLIFADYEGIVVIPAGREEEILLIAENKKDLENDVLKLLLAGESIIEIFNKYHIL